MLAGKQIGNNSNNNTQVSGDMTTYNCGISYQDAKEIAKDVFDKNFPQLIGEAQKIVEEKIEKFNNEILKEVKESEKKFHLENFKSPDFLYILYKAQEAYVRSDDDNFENIIKKSILERGKLIENSLKKIILNEAIMTINRLTKTQLEALGLIFQIKRTVKSSLNFDKKHLKRNDLGQYLEMENKDYVEIILPKYNLELIKRFTHLDAEHLIYSNCCSGNAIFDFFKNFKISYLKLFLKDKENISKEDLEKLQKMTNENRFAITPFGFDKNFYNKHILSEEEMKIIFMESDKTFEEMYAIFTDHLTNLSLTSVGIAIAILYENTKREEDYYNLDTWIGK